MQSSAIENAVVQARDLLIVATPVEDGNSRLKCLPAICGHSCVALEHTIYDMMGAMSDDYDGGFWNYFSLSNGGFFMAPTAPAFLTINSPNGYVATVTAETAGIVACAMAYSHLSFREHDGHRFAEAYAHLSDYIFQNKDAGVIRAILD